MRIRPRGVRCLSEKEIVLILSPALRLLDEVGFRIEHEGMCRRLADAGAQWDGVFQVRFPRRRMEDGLERERQRPPAGRRRTLRPASRFQGTGGIAGSPLRWVDPADGQVKPWTACSMADLVRPADALTTVTSIGTVGVPHDVSTLLQPVAARLINWRYAQRKPSNTSIVWDHRLCPLIIEFSQAAAEAEPLKGGIAALIQAVNFLVSPLRYPREEAAQFMDFVQRGDRLDIDSLPNIGGTAPVTLAGAASLALAERIAISFIPHVFYGDQGFTLATLVAPLDMRTGFMPYGRPEQTLVALAMTEISAYYGGSTVSRQAGGLRPKDRTSRAG